MTITDAEFRRVLSDRSLLLVQLLIYSGSNSMLLWHCRTLISINRLIHWFKGRVEHEHDVDGSSAENAIELVAAPHFPE